MALRSYIGWLTRENRLGTIFPEAVKIDPKSINCTYKIKMAASELDVVESLYDKAASIVVDHYSHFKNDIVRLPDHALFDVYYKVSNFRSVGKNFVVLNGCFIL